MVLRLGRDLLYTWILLIALGGGLVPFLQTWPILFWARQFTCREHCAAGNRLQKLETQLRPDGGNTFRLEGLCRQVWDRDNDEFRKIAGRLWFAERSSNECQSHSKSIAQTRATDFAGARWKLYLRGIVPFDVAEGQTGIFANRRPYKLQFFRPSV